jgi:hypothetical protein
MIREAFTVWLGCVIAGALVSLTLWLLTGIY